MKKNEEKHALHERVWLEDLVLGFSLQELVVLALGPSVWA